MPNLIRDGGFPVWFVLAFGFVAVYASARYAMKKAEEPGFIQAMMGATLFATLSATFADFGATFAHVSGQLEVTLAADPKATLPLAQIATALLAGAGESMSPGILGFSLLAITSLLVAVGRRRRALDEAA